MSTRAPGNEEQSGKVAENVRSSEIGRKFRLNALKAKKVFQGGGSDLCQMLIAPKVRRANRTLNIMNSI